MEAPLLLGAVAYNPKVVTIWNGFQQYFEKHGLPVDYVLYTNYERQVEAQFAGHIDVAWNSPLAWVQSDRMASMLGRKAEAIAMRDTDRDLTSLVIGRVDGPVRTIAETPPFDHCNFTVLDGAPMHRVARFRELLLGMSYADPQVRTLLDLEGLKQWLPGRTECYSLLAGAVDRFGTRFSVTAVDA